jgi:hypothetical protein
LTAHQHDIVAASGTPQHVIPLIPASVANVCAVQAINNGRGFVFFCLYPKCQGKKYGRWYDFNRHYNGAHAPEKTAFWCRVAECNRSEGSRNRPFPRRDKMMDHAAKMHSIEESDGMV